VRLTKLKLNTFAGTADTDYVLQPGLNVVLGPNESGKSTLYNALDWALDTRKKRRPIENFMPLAGGDTIDVEVTFEVDGSTYHLHRQAGGASTLAIKLPSGGWERNADLALQRLETLKGPNLNVWQTILLTRQGKISHTIPELQDPKGGGPDATQSLVELLRARVVSGGEVSLETIRQRLKAAIDPEGDLLAKWDEKLQAPANNKGIDNPYQRGHGQLVRLYYDWRMAERDLADTESLEARYREKDGQYAATKAQLHQTQAFLAENEQNVAALELTQPLLERQAILTKGLQDLNERLHRHAHLTQQLIQRNQALEEAKAHRKALDEQKERYVQNQALLDKLSLFNALSLDYEQYKRVVAELEPLPDATEADLVVYRHTYLRMREIASFLKAAQLQVQIEFEPGVVGEYKLSDGKGSLATLPTGPYSATLPGLVRIEHAGMVARITRPEVDAEALQREGKALKAQMEELDDRLSLDGTDQESRLKSLEALVSRRHSLTHDRKALVDRINDRKVRGGYGDTKLAAFMEECACLDANQFAEGMDAFSRLCRTLDDKAGLALSAYKEAQLELDAFHSRWVSVEAVEKEQEAMVESLTQTQNQLASAPPLPEGLPETLVAEYRQCQALALELQRQLHEQNAALKQAEEALAETDSSEELKSRIEKARTAFDFAQGKLKAARRLASLLERTLQSLDLVSFTPFEQRLSFYLALLTNGRYGKAALEASPVLPTGLLAGAHALGLEHLSKGTGDALALALRLTMAEIHLKDQTGFVVFDDPMVDMDPERALAAAKALKAFAERHQVLVLTCHPHLAKLLGGNVINLN